MEARLANDDDERSMSGAVVTIGRVLQEVARVEASKWSARAKPKQLTERTRAMPRSLVKPERLVLSIKRQDGSSESRATSQIASESGR